MSPRFPSWTRSSRGSPDAWYFLAIETTRRRLDDTKVCWAAAAAHWIRRSSRFLAGVGLAVGSASAAAASWPASMAWANRASSSLVSSGYRPMSLRYSLTRSASSPSPRFIAIDVSFWSPSHHAGDSAPGCGRPVLSLLRSPGEWDGHCGHARVLRRRSRRILRSREAQPLRARLDRRRSGPPAHPDRPGGRARLSLVGLVVGHPEQVTPGARPRHCAPNGPRCDGSRPFYRKTPTDLLAGLRVSFGRSGSRCPARPRRGHRSRSPPGARTWGTAGGPGPAFRVAPGERPGATGSAARSRRSPVRDPAGPSRPGVVAAPARGSGGRPRVCRASRGGSASGAGSCCAPVALPAGPPVA